MTRFVTSPLLTKPGVVHGFSTRLGGVSRGPYASLNLGGNVGDDPQDVAENHRLLQEELASRLSPRPDPSYPAPRFISAHQVHGRRVVHLDVPVTQDFSAGDADALITAQPGWLVGVRTADCVPILLVGDGVVAAVHAGWRGTAQAIVQAAVEAFDLHFGQKASRLRACIGPAIGPCCYPVGQEVVEGLEQALRDAPSGVYGVLHDLNRPEVQPRAALQEANRRLLLRAGVPEEAIDIIRVCVSCDEARFFSHRRDRGVSGRMFNFVGLLPGGEPAPLPAARASREG